MAAKGKTRQVRGPNKRTRVLVLNGPNLNLLGLREPEVYGHETLADIEQRLRASAASGGAALETFQSNHEGALVDRIHEAGRDGIDWLIVNPAGFTHTSVALRDALAGIRARFVEVHISNVHAREPFRRHSYFSDLAAGTICGLGTMGYDLALEYVLARPRP